MGNSNSNGLFHGVEKHLLGKYNSNDLFQAIEKHDRRNLKRILKATKARFEYVLDSQGCPPICQAAKNGYEDFVVLLLENGYHVHIPDDRCWFAVHYAASIGNTEVIYVLVYRGRADVMARCPVDSCQCAKQTALHAAALHGHYQAVEALLQCGCDVTALDHREMTPEMVAREKGFHEIADLLKRSEKLMR